MTTRRLFHTIDAIASFPWEWEQREAPAIVRSWIIMGVMVMLTGCALVATLSTGILAIIVPSLRTDEALIALMLLSLGLWRSLYVTTSWLAAGLLL